MRKKLSFQQAIWVVSLLSLVGLLFVSLSRASFTTFDKEVNGWTTSIQTSSFTCAAIVVDFIFDTPVLLSITLFMAFFLFYMGNREKGLVFTVAMLGDAIFVAFFKEVIHSTRPFNELLIVTDFSFPSGHTSGSVVFCGLLTFIIWQHWRSLKVKISSAVLSIGITSLVGFDRIYLNVHWFSDVLAGYLLGVFWLTFSIALFRYWNDSGRVLRMPLSKIRLLSR